MWWRHPRRASETQDRNVSFLELFYDLAYIVLVAELAHALAGHVDWKGVWTFAFLFAIVWWSWFNGSSYHDLHGNNDLRTRTFTYLQMFAVAAMAVFAHNALSSGSVGFAVSYAAFQLILTFLWWRTGVHDPEHRVLSNPYALTFLITTILFVASVFVPAPWRFYLWGLAVLISLVLPITQFTRRDERAQAQFERSALSLSPALVERFGLFTILVLAEVIVGVVQGLLEREQLSALAGWTGVLGMVIAFGFWGLYFDYVSHRPPVARRLTAGCIFLDQPPRIAPRGPTWGAIGSRRAFFRNAIVDCRLNHCETRCNVVSWAYAHLVITLSSTAAPVAVLNVVERAGEGIEPGVHWLLVGTIALFLVSLVPIMEVIQVPDELRRLYRVAGVFTFASAVAVALLGLTSLSAIPLLIIVVALLLVTIVYGFLVWVRVFGARDIAPH